MARSASRASAGWVSMTRLPTPAWIAMMPMLCATMSCNSLAIRSRSAVTASATSCERSATACSRRSRISRPIMHAVAIARRAVALKPISWSGPREKPKTVSSCTQNDTATAPIEALRDRVATMYPRKRSTARNETKVTGLRDRLSSTRLRAPNSVIARANSGLRRSTPTSRLTASSDPMTCRSLLARGAPVGRSSSTMG